MTDPVKIENHPGALGLTGVIGEDDREWLRLWRTAKDEVVVVLRVSSPQGESIHPHRWGAWLHDVAKNVAVAYSKHLRDEHGASPTYEEVLAEVRDGFLAEDSDPETVRTYEPTRS
jgi:hypothetical protein